MMLALDDLPEFNEDFTTLRDSYLADEALVMSAIFAQASLTQAQQQRVQQLSQQLITQARQGKHALFEDFIQSYRLNSQEGKILLTLSEALLRIPDTATRNDLINSLLTQGNWQSPSQQSTLLQWANKALHQAQHFIKAESLSDTWHQLLLKLGDSVLRPALRTGIQLLTKQFVMAETLPEALARKQSPFLYSFDCLGEAAQTFEEAETYFKSYQQALENLATQNYDGDILGRDSVSIKLSALYPRYEARFWSEIQQQLLPKLVHLLSFAAEAQIPVTFDAEESERLELSLAIFSYLLNHPTLQHYQGLGLAVQAYQKRAPAVIDWLAARAKARNKRIAVRLVKGAYWDSEIKRAQQLALQDYPVFTQKLHTDVCYLVCAKRLLQQGDCFWPQFATHNAHTLAWLQVVASDLGQSYEVQRLVGMGEEIHQHFYAQHPHPTRLYAPIGQFNTLLPYLVRRLLENGSSQSFVNLLAQNNIDSEVLSQDPVQRLQQQKITPHPKLAKPTQLFLPRVSAQGFNLADVNYLAELREKFVHFYHQTWQAGHHIKAEESLAHHRYSPVDKHRLLGTVYPDSINNIDHYFRQAHHAFGDWQQQTVSHRTQCLQQLAQQLQKHQAELLYLLNLEAGKTLEDALGEWREAIDLCQFYAQQAQLLQAPQSLPHITGEENTLTLAPRGVFVCISPWNFPLAIFIGQIAAAIVTGNTVIAKPANDTPLIAQRVLDLWLEVGLPKHIVQLVFANSHDLGDCLLEHELLAGVVFTGSTATAQHINQTLAARQGAIIPLIAETGGLNAMIADSSALPEQLAHDVMVSAFNSAGQRCSALRILWLQQDIAPAVLERLNGMLATWHIGHSQHLQSDVSSVINAHSQQHLHYYCQQLQPQALWHAHATLSAECSKGYYVAPQAFLLKRANLPQHEVFGPILHIVTWQHHELHEVIQHINQTGYGLTLGVHSRIESHIKHIQQQAQVGNLYINRNQIGAQVACQPFGGEGLSGTGFKAGGQHYLLRFCTERVSTQNLTVLGANTELLFLD
ncbi:MAG: bifunctional proline dehydrogenase/L-glutamate gamma-semialdehyde dehydrogenase PutA [Moraxellaceae bacterium]|nr:bifunctional proline dehydrogenase/L-glutamate gamma-semialdehyde dehydrogenase PutA [Moraxellaceae bacterium]